MNTRLRKAVGRGCPNHPRDVRVIQQLLNTVPKDQGGPDSPIPISKSPKFGWLTLNTVERFQRKTLGKSYGFIRPTGKTIRYLRKYARVEARRRTSIGTEGLDVEDWLQSYGQPLQEFSKDFIRILADICEDRELKYVSVTGFRSADAQARAIYNNWKRAYLSGYKAIKGADAGKRYPPGPDAALAKMLDTYSAASARRKHDKFQRIVAKDKSYTLASYQAEFRQWVARPTSVSHANGRAFDVRPRNSMIEAALREAMQTGEAEGLFRRHGDGICDETDHFHVQLVAT